MSISSCPRCAEQVTLPIGVSNSAQVRCPLCRAEYTLADALVNMPPLLEVISDSSGEHEAAWFDAPEQQSVGELPSESADALVSLDSEESSAAPGDHQSVSDDDLLFEAAEAESDDLIIEQPDTVIEDAATAAEALGGRMPPEIVPPEAADQLGDNVLDFGEPEPAVETPGESGQADDFGIDFLETPAEESFQPADELPADFGQPLGAAPAQDGFELDFEEQPPALEGDEAALDFGEPQSAGGSDDEFALDLGETAPTFEPVAAEAATEAPAADAKKSKKEKKKKEKKEKTPKPPRDPAAKRSLVGTLSAVALTSLVAIPLALYGALWIGKDYDFFGIGPKLPSWMAPAAFSKKTIASAPTLPLQLPSSNPAVPPGTAPVPAADEAPAGQADETAAKPQEEAPPAQPPAVADSQPPADTEPTPPAVAETPAKQPSTEPAADDSKSDESLESLLADDKPSADKPNGEKPQGDQPEEMPAPESDKAEDVAAASPADAPDSPTLPDASADLDALPTADAETIDPPGAREVMPEELTRDIDQVSKTLERMSAAITADDKNEIKKVRTSLYLSLYGLADALALAKHDSLDGLNGARENAERLALELAGDPARFKELRAYGSKWLAFSKRTTPGVVLTGTVNSAGPVGKLFQVKLKLAGDAPEVTVVSNADPRVSAGDQALVMGSIIARPSEELTGFEGSDAEVVWSGMTLKLPAEVQ